MKISILGARGQIARSLISIYMERGELSNLELYSRSPESLVSEIKGAKVYPSEAFICNEHEVIINCIGISNLKGIKNSGREILHIHEAWDNLILEYLKRNKNALYINMSSGAVYGKLFQNPVTETSCLLNGVTEISPEYFYAVAKLNAEAKHRSFDKSNIVDLRIFSYISKFIDFNSNFLISEIMKAIKDKQIFITNVQNISRDYLHPEDMVQIINLVIKKWKEVGFINDTFDTYSRNPVTKMDMLKSLSEKYNLQFEIKDEANIDSSATGFKMNYYSVNRKLKNLGYEPLYSSLEAILKVFSEVL
jgi:nucleoside-diphosphate-sugar epimerase